jgi:hypothetical protein
MSDDIRVMQSELKTLRARVIHLSERVDQLQRFAPPIAAERARRSRFIYEVIGLTITAIGTAYIYPPAAALVVGGWMLADIVVSRSRSRNHGRPNKDRSNA